MVCPLEGPLTLDDAVVRAADRAARIWKPAELGRSFSVARDTRRPSAACSSTPTTPTDRRLSIGHPRTQARDRRVSPPIWDIAMQTEGNASLRVLSYAATIKDPLLREAVEIDGFEETRTSRSCPIWYRRMAFRWRRNRNTCVRAVPRAFLLAGFCECVYTFLLLVSFAPAKRSGFFPPALVDTFEPVVQGGGPAYSIFCQLGGLAPAQSADVATFSSRSKFFRSGLFLFGRGLVSPSMVPAVDRRRRVAGTTTLLHRRQGDSGRRHVGRRPDWRLPERVRAPLFRLRTLAAARVMLRDALCQPLPGTAKPGRGATIALEPPDPRAITIISRQRRSKFRCHIRTAVRPCFNRGPAPLPPERARPDLDSWVLSAENGGNPRGRGSRAEYAVLNYLVITFSMLTFIGV